MTRLGIIGGGQLARMLTQAAAKLDITTLVLDPNTDACAGQLTELIEAEYDDQQALQKLADQCDVLTFDFENVPADGLRQLAQQCRICPSADVLAVAQDRLLEKNLFRELDIDVGDYFAVNSRPDLLAALEQTGYPAVLKTRRFGYDGKGQQVLRQAEDLEYAWRELGQHELILEQFIPFDWECSIIGVRNDAGDMVFYPLTRNHHIDGILAYSHAPIAGLNPELQGNAQAYLQRIADQFAYVGVLTLELFVVGGQLLANEIAPRVHNSGHWSIDGTVCSQFENHLRACAGLALVSPQPVIESLMVNWISEIPKVNVYQSIEGLHWHDYGKAARKGRKVGHATLTAANIEQLQSRLAQWTELSGNNGLLDFYQDCPT